MEPELKITMGIFVCLLPVFFRKYIGCSYIMECLAGQYPAATVVVLLLHDQSDLHFHVRS